MYRRIVVPLDGSALGESVLPHAIALGSATGAALHLLRVSRSAPRGAGGAARSPSAEGRYLGRIARQLGVAGVVATIATGRGDPADAIVAEARERADLIAMATHGRGGLGRLLFGSIAASVLAHAPVPVLLVRAWPPAPAASAFAPTPLVLVPLDGSAHGETSLPAAANLANCLGGRLHLLRVVDPDTPPVPPLSVSNGELDPALLRYLQEAHDGPLAEAQVYLHQMAVRLAAAGHAATVEVRVGPVTKTILAARRELGATIVAMASHGFGGVLCLVLGTVSEAVLRAGTFPLLLVGPAARPRARAGERLGVVG